MDPHHRYMRPPPLASADPRQQPPPPGQWYPPSSQFQYQNAPPPQQQQQQWGAPPPPPYPSHHQIHYPPPHHHRPYPPPQDWGNTNWGHHPGWEYPAVRQDEEDWAAKARAWAESKVAIDGQHPQPQFTSANRLEGQSPYHDPYTQTIDGHYADVQSSNPSPGYHQYPAPGASSQKPSLVHPQEYAGIHSGPSSFVQEEHGAYGSKDGSFGGAPNAVYHHQESSSVSSLVHMQEVPSSYSSITGKVETGDGREKLYKSFPYPTDSNQLPYHDHLPPPVGRSALTEQHFPVGNHAAEIPVDRRDQPLSFTRKFSFDHEQMMKQNYSSNNDSGGPVRGVDPVAAAPSNYSLTSPHFSGTVYPSFPSVHPSAQQHGPSVSLTSSFPGLSIPSFGTMPGPSFQSSIPAVDIGATSGLHPTAAFPGDLYGVLNASDRHKKALVPDWLKEQIIKTKATIASSVPERPTDSIEDEAFDKTPGRADQEDSKSIDSSRSALEEDEEDNMEAARTAEVNQEIKRILTEVLLKVTDELFDEIATQVLEEDLTTEDAEDTVASYRKPSFAVPAASTPKVSAKVLVAAKGKEVETEDESEKSSSSSPGDLLGLANYASDDDDDDADDSIQPNTEKLSTDDYRAENSDLPADIEGDSKSQAHGNSYKSKLVSNGDTINHDGIDDHNSEGNKTVENPGTSKPNNSGEKVIRTEAVEDVSSKVSAAGDSRGKETRNKQDNKDDNSDEARNSYVQKENVKAADGSKDTKGDKEAKSHTRHDERHAKSEMTTDKSNGWKEKQKEQSGKSGEKGKESDSRKRSSDPDGKMDRKEDRNRRTNDKDDSDRRREQKKDEKGERSRDKRRSELGRERRRRSPSAGSRGRSSKGNSVAGHTNYSSDESSDDSKRKLRRKKRNQSRSPSPSRSRKRQDSRSPPSKRSHRRHSPFSSLETARGRRSRSRSPARRQR